MIHLNDFNQLLDTWYRIEKKADRDDSPVLVYEDLETASSVVRDFDQLFTGVFDGALRSEDIDNLQEYIVKRMSITGFDEKK